MSSLGRTWNGASRSGWSRGTVTFAVCLLLGAFATAASAQRSPIPEEPGLENARGLDSALDSTLPLPGSLRMTSAEIEREVMHLQDQIDSFSSLSLGRVFSIVGAGALGISFVVWAIETVVGRLTSLRERGFQAGLIMVGMGGTFDLVRGVTRRRLEREMETLQARRIYVDVSLERAMATVSWRL